MKFTIKQSELLAALQIVYPAIKSSIIIPICETIKFDLAEDKITLTATNIQVELSTIIAGKFEEVGAFCLPAVKLYNLISNLPDQPLKFETDKVAVIKTDSGKYEFPISKAEDFPVFKTDADKTITINAEILQSAINKTIFACSTDTDKPQQTGVFVEISKDKILFTSTDSHRVNHIECDIITDLENSIIIPASSLSLLPKFKGAIELLFSKNSICITNSGTSFKSTLIDAEFPAYRTVIPVNDKILTIDKNLLIGAIKRVSGFANFATNLLKLDIKDTIKLSGQNIEYSEYAEEILDGQFSEGEIIIGLSAKYLSESAASVDKPVIYMLFSKPNSGVLIKEDLDSNNYIMVMPMQLI